jgi:hypothetical protein
VISIWQNTSFRSRPPCLSPLRWVQSARAYGMHPALASGTPLCLFLEFQPTHRLLDKFRRNSPTRVFLSDSCRALYKDSYLSERLVCCLQVVCCFDACMLLNLKEVVGAKGFEPSTSWSRTRRASQAALRPDKHAPPQPMAERGD